jgi:hypothetical protein
MLRFPDNSAPRKVKCPSCNYLFTAGTDGPMEENNLPASGNSAEIEPAAIPPKKTGGENFDDFDRSSRSRRRGDDDYESGRSGRRDNEDRERNRRRQDEDSDDRYRRRRSRDDDYGDRDRRRRSSDDDYDYGGRSRSRGRGRDSDDEYDRRRARAEATQFRYARQGFNLISIGFWCQVGAMGIGIFFLFLGIVCGEIVPELLIPAGLAGLANWILAIICFSFFLAGRKKGHLLGLNIALVAVSGLHLIAVTYLAFHNEARFHASGSAGINWDAFTTNLGDLVQLILDDHVVIASLLAGMLELARFVLFTLVLKEYGRICRDRDVSGSGGILLVLLPCVVGVSLFLFLMLKLIYKNAGVGSEGKYVYFLILLIQYGGYLVCYCMSALACAKAKDAITYRKSR